MREKFPTVESIYGRFAPLVRRLAGLPPLMGDPIAGDGGVSGVVAGDGAGGSGGGDPVAGEQIAGEQVAQAVGAGDGGAGGVVVGDGAGGSRAGEAVPAAPSSRRRASYAAYGGFVAYVNSPGFAAQVNRRRSKIGCKPQDLPTSRHEDRDGDGKEGDKGGRDLGIGLSSSSSAGSSGDTTKNDAGSSGLSNNLASKAVLKLELCAKIVDKYDMSPLDDKSLVVTIIVVKSEDILISSLLSNALAVAKSFDDSHSMIKQNIINSDAEGIASNRMAIPNDIAIRSPLCDEADSARAVMVSAAMSQFAEENY